MTTRTSNGLPPALDDSCKSLYVGNLHPKVTDSMLGEIFRTIGEVTHVKIIPDKTHAGLNYGFIDFLDHKTALLALETLHGRKVLGHEIKVNWAYQGNNATREDTSSHYHVFVGDLSPDVTDAVLLKAFDAFGNLTDARVMWDMNTGKSRGYGFLAFRDKLNAERAIEAMNGEWIGSRAIRVNWANQKGQAHRPIQTDYIPYVPPQPNMPPTTMPSSMQGGMPPPLPPPPPTMGMPQTLSYDVVVNQSSPTNTTVYVGNLAPTVREADLYPYFQPYGYIAEVRLQHDRGFAFVRMDTHEHAAMAICYLNGTQIHGRPVKASWGKDRYAEVDPNAAAAAAASTGHFPSSMGYNELPALTDPIAAAAAAAAQAAVAYQMQQLQGFESTSQPEGYSQDYYAYYYQYYFGQQQQQQQQQQQLSSSQSGLSLPPPPPSSSLSQQPPTAPSTTHYSGQPTTQMPSSLSNPHENGESEIQNE